MPFDSSSLFDEYADKIVSANDKQKDAYVLTTAQLGVFLSAGIPVHDGGARDAPPFLLNVLNSSHPPTIETSVYRSLRQGSGRAGEPRMGRKLISDWLEPGDILRIGRICSDVFALKLDGDIEADQVARRLSAVLPSAVLHHRVGHGTGLGATQEVTTTRYVRNPLVVAAAIQRANNRCERPGCTRSLFRCDDGTNYLEVHHVVPLSEQGPDTMSNVAALCPSCHREVHFGTGREELRNLLLNVIQEHGQIEGGI